MAKAETNWRFSLIKKKVLRGKVKENYSIRNRKIKVPWKITKNGENSIIQRNEKSGNRETMIKKSITKNNFRLRNC